MERPDDTTGATEEGRPATRMKEPHVIRARWEELFDMRRRVEQDDLKAISDPKLRADIHNMWMKKVAPGEPLQEAAAKGHI